ncbi:unnamed protein product [Caenorhabditis auriculariae]|uniref:Uncharacterized protein n=1 Tax=Caenorhabditis auriculariae TaxID=2777116 RepID=A0A8S1HWA6_9PELO|nr:unnamed protein product [Caenorhabditis auriculariae]
MGALQSAAPPQASKASLEEKLQEQRSLEQELEESDQQQQMATIAAEGERKLRAAKKVHDERMAALKSSYLTGQEKSRRSMTDSVKEALERQERIRKQLEEAKSKLAGLEEEAEKLESEERNAVEASERDKAMEVLEEREQRATDETSHDHQRYLEDYQGRQAQHIFADNVNSINTISDSLCDQLGRLNREIAAYNSKIPRTPSDYVDVVPNTNSEERGGILQSLLETATRSVINVRNEVTKFSSECRTNTRVDPKRRENLNETLSTLRTSLNQLNRAINDVQCSVEGKKEASYEEIQKSLATYENELSRLRFICEETEDPVSRKSSFRDEIMSE